MSSAIPRTFRDIDLPYSKEQKVKKEEGKEKSDIFKDVKEFFNSFSKDDEDGFTFYHMKNSDKKIEVFLNGKKYIERFQTNMYLKINEKDKTIVLYSTLNYPSGEVIMVRGNNLRLLLCRYLTRLNSSFRFGCFLIYPPNGQLILKMSNYVEDSFDDVIKGKNFKAFFRTVYHTNLHAINFYICKLLYILNMVTSGLMIVWELENSDQKTIKKVLAHEGIIEDIKKFIIHSSTPYKDYKDVDKQKYDPYFKPPNYNLPKNYTALIIQDDIITEENKSKIGEGGFGEVLRVRLRVIEGGRELHKFYACKTDKPSAANAIEGSIINNENKIKNEQKILERLKNCENCPYIANFYYSEKPFFKNLLLSDYYQNKSLDYFKYLYGATMTLNTKLYILTQIALGLKFLNDKKIYHLDIKPGNILIAKNDIVKIIDFGEAVCMDDPNYKSAKPGRTFPYVAPEVLKQEIEYNDRMDVFSFGVIMCEFLFNQYPVDFLRNQYDQLQTKYVKGIYKIKLLEENMPEFGPKHLMRLLRLLVLKCCEHDPKKRPHIDWIIIILRESLQYIEKTY